MPHRNRITGKSEDETWNIIADQLNKKNDDRDYTAQIATGQKTVTLDIDLNPDRGEENEKPVTTFTVQLPIDMSFRFKIEKQGLKHDIGKLFGLQDVIVGNQEFDKKFLVQTNDEAKLKKILSEPDVFTALLNLPVQDFKVRERKIGTNLEIVLGLCLEGGITEPETLKTAFQPFKIALNSLDK